jgi:hypothetical protein
MRAVVPRKYEQLGLQAQHIRAAAGGLYSAYKALSEYCRIDYHSSVGADERVDGSNHLQAGQAVGFLSFKSPLPPQVAAAVNAVWWIA